MLTVNPQGKQNRSRDSHSVKSVRGHHKKLSPGHQQNHSKAQKKNLKLTKKKHDDAYLKAGADFMEGKIHDLSFLYISNKHLAAWKIIKKKF